MSITTTTRNADLPSLVDVLRTQRAQRHDVVVPASFITAQGGGLTIEGDEVTVLGEDGVSTVRPLYSPTVVAEDGISEKLGIHRGYLRRLRAEHLPLWDANVNGWLRHESTSSAKYLVRTLRDSTTGEGVVRAMLSNGFKPVENLDVVVAALEGIADAGVEAVVDRCDLTDRRMYVTLHAPQVAVEAARLLDGYRGPWHSDAIAERRILTPTDLAAERDALGEHHMYQPGTEPIIFGGLEISNSDTGCGAFTLAGKLRVLRCTNGLMMDAGKLRKVHLGQRMDEGVIDWSTRTQEAMLTVVKEQTRDAVAKFLSPEYVREQVAAMEERAGVSVADPTATIKHVTKALTYSDSRADDVLAHFIAGGQLTAGGVMQAVTSVIEGWIREYPDQWLWLHRRWR